MDKKGQTWETLIPWMIGIAILVIALLGFISVKNSGLSAGEYFKNLLRFG